MGTLKNPFSEHRIFFNNKRDIEGKRNRSEYPSLTGPQVQYIFISWHGISIDSVGDLKPDIQDSNPNRGTTVMEECLWAIHILG